MTRYRPLILPFIMTALGLAVLISLGVWQLERRDWKLGLIDRIEARATGETISLSGAKHLWQQDQDVEYYRVLLIGRFLHEYERHLYTIVDGQAGWRIITPLRTQKGELVLVDRGFVPEELKAPETRGEGQVGGTVELTGLARISEHASWFVPDNQPDTNRWFRRNIPGLIASLPQSMVGDALPFMIEAEHKALPGGWPRGGVTRLSLPNRHLEYALTWFGLAGALLAVFTFFVRHRLRQPSGKEYDAEIADESGSV